MRGRAARIAVLAGSMVGFVRAGLAIDQPASLERAYSNSIIFDRPGLATCTLWLDADRRYAVFCKRPTPSTPATVEGPWELESREGRYRIDGKRLCLRPDAVPGKFGIAVDGVLYGAQGCYDFSLGDMGTSWSSRDSMGRNYTMRLVPGR